MLTDERLAQIRANQRRRLRNVPLRVPIDGANLSAFYDVRDVLEELERRAAEIDALKVDLEEAQRYVTRAAEAWEKTKRVIAETK